MWLPYRTSPACMTTMLCDIGCAADVYALWQTTSLGPVRVVVHAGGALKDATLAQQSMSSVRIPFAGKLQVILRNMTHLILAWSQSCR